MNNKHVSTPARIPALLHFLTPCPFIDEFVEDDKLRGEVSYSTKRSLNVLEDGVPLYCSLFKTPPTSCMTPGKWIPGGFTSTGKWKIGHHTKTKTDKRAGK